MPFTQRITIIRTDRKKSENLNDEIRWLCNSLGLFNVRDKDSSCYRIFIELLRSTKEAHPISSDEIARKLSLSRGTVMHHVNKLMSSGLVITEHSKYSLRVSNLEVLMDEIEHDLNRAFSDMKTMAKKIDKELGL